MLYCFFVIEHRKRQILQFNVTLHPTSEWIVEVLTFLKASALKPMRTSVRSPCQNGIAERWAGSVRCELLDPG